MINLSMKDANASRSGRHRTSVDKKPEWSRKEGGVRNDDSDAAFCFFRFFPAVFFRFVRLSVNALPASFPPILHRQRVAR